MDFDTHVNLLIGTVMTPPVPATTGETLVLMPGDSGFVPNMPVTLCPGDVQWPSRDNSEVGYLVAVDGTTLTIQRGQEGTTPMQVKAGWKVLASITAKTIEDLEAAIAAVATSVDGKVDKVAGKGLSTNDYTTDEKTKLAGVAPGATQNASDASLRDRTTHTGTQAISTVTGLQTALNDKANASHTHLVAQVTDLQNLLDAKISTSQLGANNGVATLDGSGKVNQTQLPGITIVEVSTVNSQAAMLALPADEGDVAIRTDLNKTFIHNGGTTGTVADWSEMLTPTDNVTSVNGQTGAVTVNAVPTGGAEGQVLKIVSGTVAWGADNNTTYSAPTQAEAEAGTATNARVFSAQRVNQAIQALSPVKSWAGKTGVITPAIADISGLQTAIDAKANDSAVMHNTGAESVTGVKTFANGIAFTNGTFTSTINISTLSVNRNLSLPNNSGTLLTQSSTESLSNKTINASVNTLTNIGLGSIPMMATNGKGFINHGADASVARPVGFASVEWRGSIQPTNMTTNDTWIETA